MATIRAVERQIRRVEGFEVRILHGRDRRDVRGDKAGVHGYAYHRQIKGSKNVREWRDGRFAERYPGFEVEVLKADGTVAHGRMLLTKVRDSYLADE